MTLQRVIEALREPLLGAARDGFAGLAEAPGLGGQLRRACDRLLRDVGGDDAPPLRDWRAALDQFESLEIDRQAIEVARGLRLCHGLGGRPRPRARPAAVTTDPLAAPLDSLPGIGPALAERLGERGLACVEDLIWLVPRRYDDVRQILDLDAALAAASPGERITAVAQVASCRFVGRGRRRWVDLRLRSAGGASLVIRWFNAHGGMVKRFPVGADVALSGRVQERGGALEMANPDVLYVETSAAESDGAAPGGVPRPPTEPCREARSARSSTPAPSAPGKERGGTPRNNVPGIISRYAEVPGVPPATLRKSCLAALARVSGLLRDPVPADVTARLSLPGLEESLRALHSPPETLSVDDVAALSTGDSPWHRRLAFDELFVLGVAIADRRRRQRADVAVACPAGTAARAEAALPFSLTMAQRRAIESIERDLARPVPMNRLLQGDVGCGKTAVAFAAVVQAVAAGRQAALMAPTELLAEQHRRTLESWCASAGIRVAGLTASTPRPVRSSTLSLLSRGDIDLLIGTHALIAESVQFGALGLVIIDEQHRFGVAQRARLRGKGDGSAPHLLVMTATPIPRTLALTVYGDLDVTVIDELPPGRTPAQTLVVTGARGRDQIYKRLGDRVVAGERGFVVCPLVAPPEQPDEGGRDWHDATTTCAELSERLPGVRFGLVHGRMSSPERDEVMERFRGRDIDVLVGTTVVEVGVDVPDATIMIIEDASYFGLSQLHQLRGRVGRGQGTASHCILLAPGQPSDDAAQRLAIMAETCDGFRIAEEDLRIRGPGELMGIRQAGLPRLRFGDLTRHVELMLQARAEAERILAESPELSREQDRPLREALARRSDGEVFGAEGG